MRLLLGFRDINTVDNWRRKLGFQHEHTEGKGEHRGVWLFAPSWLAAWHAAGRSDGPGACAVDKKPTTRDETDQIKLRNAQLDLEEREGKVVDVDEFFTKRLAPCLDEFRVGVEVEARRDPEVGKRLAYRIEKGIEKLQANGSADLLSGHRPAGRKRRRKIPPKDSADAS